jgi:hypothetical protein
MDAHEEKAAKLLDLGSDFMRVRKSMTELGSGPVSAASPFI